MTDELRDQLPGDLNPEEHFSEYEFPDNSRRRIPGAIYLVTAAFCIGLYFVATDSAVVNRGWLAAGGVFAAIGSFHIITGVRMNIDVTEALIRSQQALRFPVGHASAQQSWRGWLSRPVWRILCYSADEPSTQRGLVVVDAVTGEILEELVQHDIDDWDPTDV